MFSKIKKFVSKYSTIFLWGLVAIIVFLSIAACGVFLKGTTNELMKKEVIPLFSGEKHKQEVVIDKSMSITDFSISFATYARENDGVLNVSLYSNEQLIETWEMNVSQLVDNEYYTFDLTEDLKVNVNDEVYIEIYELYEGENAIAIWVSENVELPFYKNDVLVENSAICHRIGYAESVLDFCYNNWIQIIIAVVAVVILKKIWNKCKNGTDKGYLLFLLVLLSTMYVLLYYPYISGKNVYIYEGIGCATLNQYWPKYVFNLNFLQNVGNSGYSLQWGFGRYVNFVPGVFLNPFDWVFLFVEKTYALIVSLYVKIIWTGCFAWEYFRKKFQYKEIALICAILWTFGGWFVLWGQHYAFASYYAYFTAILFFLELLIEKNRFWILFPIILAIMTGNNYYFTYMIGIFCVLYLIFTAMVKRWNIKELLWKMIKLGGAEVIAVLLSFVQLYPSLDSFFNSNRTDSLKMLWIELFKPRELSYLVTYIGRMLSSNIWGIEDYSGTCNYYEMAISYSSCLVIVAIVYFLYTKSWEKIALTILGCCVLVMLPITSKIMQFDVDSYRWTFLLNIGTILLVGKFLERFFVHAKKEEFSKVYKAVLVSNVGIICLLCAITYISKNNVWGLRADATAIVQVCIVWAIFDVLVLVLKITKCNSWQKIVPFLIIFVCVEQLFMNYYVVNERREISCYSLENGYYNDGTTEVVEELKTMDSSLYRLNKTYFSVFYDDPYIQGYNGLSIYSSTNSASLHSFIKNLDIENLNNHQNYVSIDAKDRFVNELLAVKYLIAEDGTNVDDGYIEVLRKNDLILYEDMNALPFGYLYTEQLNVDQYAALEGTNDKSAAMMLGFYSTEISGEFAEVDLSNGDVQENVEKGRELLKNTKIYDVIFNNSTYSAKIINDSGKKAMLCVPLIYHDRWETYINGQEVKTFNINGGLIGVEIPNGEYTVQITYNALDYDIMQIVSMISWIAYAIFLVCWIKRVSSC